MRVVAGLLIVCTSLVRIEIAEAQTSPFAGHWQGTQHCNTGDRAIVLDIVQSADGFLTPTMKAGGIGTLEDGRVAGDTITMNWSNFLSHVTFTGKFTSADRVEGTYHESITGEDCAWSATKESSQMAVADSDTRATPQPPEAPAAQLAANTPNPLPATPQAPSELDRWKAEADQDRQKLNGHLGADAKARAVRQFCEYAPDQAACAARIGVAYEYLAHNIFSTLTIASHDKAVPLPATEPGAGLPSYYDVYQVYAYLIRDGAR